MTQPTRTDTREHRFFAAAEPLFERFGYRKTTVEEICRAAGMSKRTFYELFEDKQDLLLRWLETTVNEMTAAWEASLSPDLDPLERLHSFLEFYARMAREHPALHVMFEDLDLMRLFGERAEEMRMVRLGGPLDRILRDGVATGQFRQLDPRAAMWVMFGLLDTVYLLMPRVMNAPSPLDDAVLARETQQFVVRGLGAIDDAPRTTRTRKGARTR